MFRGTPKYSRLSWLLWRLERNPLRKPRNAAAKFSTVSLYTQRGIRGNGGEYCSASQQVHESKGIASFGPYDGGASDEPLDNSRDNEYYEGHGISFRRCPEASPCCFAGRGFSKRTR